LVFGRVWETLLKGEGKERFGAFPNFGRARGEFGPRKLVWGLIGVWG